MATFDGVLYLLESRVPFHSCSRPSRNYLVHFDLSWFDSLIAGDVVADTVPSANPSRRSATLEH